MKDVLDIFIRSAVSFGILLLLARWMGRKQMAQLTYFDYITGITIGSIAGEVVVQHRDIHLLDGLFGLLFWTCFAVLLNWIVVKSRRARRLLDGEPRLVIRDGKVLEQNLGALRYTIDDLLEELREKDVFAIADVLFGIIETDGRLSVQLKPDQEPVLREDVQVAVPAPSLPVELVVDGQVITENLRQQHLANEWLREELAKRGVTDMAEVAYACLDSDRRLYVDVREDSQ